MLSEYDFNQIISITKDTEAEELCIRAVEEIKSQRKELEMLHTFVDRLKLLLKHVPQEFLPGTKVRLKGDLSPWKIDPQKGAEGVVVSHEHGIVAVKFNNYDSVHYSYPEGLEIVGE